MRTVTLCALALMFVPGCVFPSAAKRWNDRVDRDGEPVYYVSASKVGLNLLIFIPFFGDLDIDGLVHEVTEYIKEKDGNGVRIVQANSENYWYGYSPFTWVVSPVVATVAAEYRPSLEEQREQEELEDTGAHEPRWYMPWTW